MLTSLNQPSTMDDEMNKFRSDANNCFVCGPENPIGLKLILASATTTYAAALLHLQRIIAATMESRMEALCLAH